MSGGHRTEDENERRGAVNKRRETTREEDRSERNTMWESSRR
jgi:hypothetical protein